MWSAGNKMESLKQVDFSHGVPVAGIPDGAFVEGKLGADDVILVRSGSEFFAVGATWPHYGGPLAQGLLLGDELRCPLHHACFSLRTGEALRAPALDAIPCWRVERIGDKVFLRDKLPAPVRMLHSAGSKNRPASVVII